MGAKSVPWRMEAVAEDLVAIIKDVCQPPVWPVLTDPTASPAMVRALDRAVDAATAQATAEGRGRGYEAGEWACSAMKRCRSATEITASAAGVATRSVIHWRMSAVAGIPRSAAWARTWSMSDCGSRTDNDTGASLGPRWPCRSGSWRRRSAQPRRWCRSSRAGGRSCPGPCSTRTTVLPSPSRSVFSVQSPMPLAGASLGCENCSGLARDAGGCLALEAVGTVWRGADQKGHTLCHEHV